MNRSNAGLSAILVLVIAPLGCLQAPGALPTLSSVVDDGGAPDRGDLGPRTDAAPTDDAASAPPDVGDASPGADASDGDADEVHVLWQQVTVGENFACGLTADGIAYCWGSEANGRLGSMSASGALDGFSAKPLLVGAPEQRWTAITAGRTHACAIEDDGFAYCWGDNTQGAVAPHLALGPQRAPAAVMGGTVRLLAAGDGHSCAVTENELLLCWGNNDAGQTGADPAAQAVTVTTVAEHQSAVVALSLGSQISCLQDGAVQQIRCWGSSVSSHAIYGRELSCGSACDELVLAPRVVVDGDQFRSLSLGFDHICAINDDGFNPEGFCWGSNLDPLSNERTGKLGDPDVVDVRSPNKVPGFLTTGLESTSAGTAHSCAIGSFETSSDPEPGGLWCWGQPDDGALGVGPVAPAAATHQAMKVSGRWSSVSAGAYVTCAIKTDQTLWCWGRNAAGQLGVGDQENRFVPTPVDDP